MKRTSFLFLLFLISRNVDCFAITPPDSLLINTHVEFDIDFDDNMIKSILYYRDTSIVCRQVFNDGKLYRVNVYDTIGRPLGLLYFHKNGRVSETQEYKDGVITRKIFYKKSGKTDVIFLFKNGIQVDFIRYGSDGQPLRKKNT